VPAKVVAAAWGNIRCGIGLTRSARLLCETLGEFNQNTPIGRILDFSEGDDQPQSFDDVQVDLIVAKQLQQFIPGVIGIVDVHR
jgi:hypothetical protein